MILNIFQMYNVMWARQVSIILSKLLTVKGNQKVTVQYVVVAIFVSRVYTDEILHSTVINSYFTLYLFHQYMSEHSTFLPHFHPSTFFSSFNLRVWSVLFKRSNSRHRNRYRAFIIRLRSFVRLYLALTFTQTFGIRFVSSEISIRLGMQSLKLIHLDDWGMDSELPILCI